MFARLRLSASTIPFIYPFIFTYGKGLKISFSYMCAILILMII